MLKIIEPIQVPEDVSQEPAPALDWPELDTVPADLLDDDPCPWKQSNFL